MHNTYQYLKKSPPPCILQWHISRSHQTHSIHYLIAVCAANTFNLSGLYFWCITRQDAMVWEYPTRARLSWDTKKIFEYAHLKFMISGRSKHTNACVYCSPAGVLQNGVILAVLKLFCHFKNLWLTMCSLWQFMYRTVKAAYMHINCMSINIWHGKLNCKFLMNPWQYKHGVCNNDNNDVCQFCK